MSATPPATPTNDKQSFSVLYVIIGGAALLSAVVFPIAFVFALRYHRRRLQSLEQQQLGAPVVTAGEKLQQEKPKLFNIYVKPGLEVHEARFEHILPLTVYAAPARHAHTASTDPLSTFPSVLRRYYQLRSRDWEVYDAEAPIDEDAFKIYNAAVFIAMPHSHAVVHWNELGEYVVGTTKLVAPASLDNMTPS